MNKRTCEGIHISQHAIYLNSPLIVPFSIQQSIHVTYETNKTENGFLNEDREGMEYIH